MATLTPDLLYARLLGRARLKHLQLVVHIAELHSLQKAASAIGQPAATHSLAEFEALLGIPLFERHARGMRPSPAGRALLPLVRQALKLLQACAETAASMQHGATGLVRVGAIHAAVAGWLTQALPVFSRTHPDVLVEVLEVPADQLLQMVEHGRVDIVLCREPQPLPEGHVFTPVRADHYVVLCRNGHPLAGKAQVSDDELRAQTWLVPPLTGIAPAEFSALCARLGGAPRTCQVSSRSALLSQAMLDSGDLLALSPYQFARPALEAGLLTTLFVPQVAMPPLGILRRAAMEAGGPSAVARLVASLVDGTDLP
jgi:DNA-binding transcriptional LysR family regulator